MLGPEPAAFAPEVTSDELRQEIRNSMLGWENLFTPDSPYNNRFHQVFFVLNNCRALRGLHEGKLTSKREGAKWAKQHLDAQWHALIDYCWQEGQDTGINVSQPADPQAFQRTVAFVAYTTRLAEEYQLSSLREGAPALRSTVLPCVHRRGSVYGRRRAVAAYKWQHRSWSTAMLARWSSASVWYHRQRHVTRAQRTWTPSLPAGFSATGLRHLKDCRG